MKYIYNDKTKQWEEFHMFDAEGNRVYRAGEFEVSIKYMKDTPKYPGLIEATGSIEAGVLGSDVSLDTLEDGSHIAEFYGERVVLLKTRHGSTITRLDEKDAMVDACKQFMRNLVSA
jgi:hypothetical protein